MEGLIVLILIFWVLPAILKKAKNEKGKQQSAGTARSSAARQTPSVVRSAHRDFPVPGAPCIVCENTGEDHFKRDKARRIAQLDDWLKNGLIDRSEYRVLKDRYERGI